MPTWGSAPAPYLRHAILQGFLKEILLYVGHSVRLAGFVLELHYINLVAKLEDGVDPPPGYGHLGVDFKAEKVQDGIEYRMVVRLMAKVELIWDRSKKPPRCFEHALQVARCERRA